MGDLCSHVISLLDNEENKAAVAVKGCKKNCRWTNRKHDLIEAAHKKAKESCARGEAPDVNEINKGLDGNAKERLKNLYDRNSRMFDVTAKLPDKDFKPIPSKQAALLTGKGDQVTDLKFSEPDIPKLNTASEFSLSGTKLSGGTPGQAATKQSPALLASASSAKSPADAAASAKAVVSATAKAITASAAGIDPGVDCAGTIEAWAITNPEYAATCDCRNGQGAPPVCGCSAGKVTIAGPKDLLLFKTYTNSPKVPFKVITSKPLSKIQWSLSNAKVKFTSGTNQKTVQVIPTAESKPEGDVTITATVDNCPPVSLALTVRRPVSIEHEPLKLKVVAKGGFLPTATTDDRFIWTVKDQFLKPLGNTRVSEVVWCDPIQSNVKCWKAGFFRGIWPWPMSITTLSDGTMRDEYAFSIILLPRIFKLVIHQKLGCQGYTGTSDVEFTQSNPTGTDPVVLGVGTSPIELK
ncbi:MAG: hypothetical protein HY796_00940 [Elusimicrobia bacterium]|nr:hypothetical protein [Elusimicrobiota bacterium]